MSKVATSQPSLGRRQSSEPTSSSLSAPMISRRSADNGELHRRGSQSSRHSNLGDDSPILGSQLNAGSHSSSQSGSKASSLLPTPKILSRRNSAKEGTRAFGSFGRKRSVRDKSRNKEIDLDEFGGQGSVGHTPGSTEGMRSPFSEASSSVIETPYLRTERDPETGKKMINQYLLLSELGRGTHGTVRLCRDISTELPASEDAELGLGLSGSSRELYAVKIVDRVSKRQRLQQLGANRYPGGRMVRGDDIRKEIAIFKKLHHPNVVKMVEIIDDPESSKIFMIMEYCEGGEVRWREGLGQPALSVAESRKIFRETLLGLEHLHHQGVIHRDIKPSNLLYGRDRSIKITDFGCSHYSEALQVASASPGHTADAYVADIELAKTAGTPAFYAPEMCFSGEEDQARSSSSPLTSPSQEIPKLIVRPPSIASSPAPPSPPSPRNMTIPPSESSSAAFRRVSSNDSVLSQKPLSIYSRSSEAVTLHKRHVPLITNAIDVWALGITLYCLLFGTTPYEAVPEYVLMQIIPTTEIEIPPYMGSERMPTGGRDGGMGESQEARDCIDLLSSLLEKNVTRRITLEQAKHHPFTLHGLPDPSSWLTSTDPHAQTFVTVSNAEVEAVVIKSSSFRDRFRRGIKTISHKLQLLGTAGRSRSRSIGDTDPSNPASSSLNMPIKSPGSGASSSVQGSRQHQQGIRSRDPSPMNSPDLSSPVGRRYSLLSSKFPEPLPSPRRSTAHQTSPIGGSEQWRNPQASPGGNRRPSGTRTTEGGLVPQRRVSNQFASGGGYVASPITIDLADDQVLGPRPAASALSLDKLSFGDSQYPGEALRQPASDVDLSRQRSMSNASSHATGFGGKIARLLSQRSRQSRRSNAASVASDIEPTHRPTLTNADRRASVDGTRSSLDSNPLESGSYSSQGAWSLRDRTRASTSPWESRPQRQPARRGSNLGENPYTAEDLEPDWNETLSDSSDEADIDTGSHDDALNDSANPTRVDSPRADRLAHLPLEDVEHQAVPTAVSTPPSLETIKDASPSELATAVPQPQLSPANPNFHGFDRSSRPTSRVSSRPSGNRGQARAAERTKSPLGWNSAIQSGTPDPEEGEAGEDEDEGLAITTGTRRFRAISSANKQEEATQGGSGG